MTITTYKDWTIQSWVAIVDETDNDYIWANDFADVKEARRYIKENHLTGVKTIWCAAEWINKDGDLNPSVKGRTERDAFERLKKVLDS